MTFGPSRIALALVVSLTLGACSGGKGPTGGTAAGTDANAVHIKTGCDRFYFGGTEPAVAKPTLAKGLKRLCYRSFALGYSPVSRTALWSAEVVDATSVRFARKLERRDEFHPEEQLAPKKGTRLDDSPRAELADYRGSGYDRGHLAPSGDMPTRASQEESFSLANIVPQAPKLNRGSWAELESDIRDQSFDVKRIYVLTGPVFNGRNVAVINERVMIPSHIWKAILIPDKGATVYVASNTDYPVWKTMSVAKFTRFAGINPFPGIPEQFANADMAAGEKPGDKKKSGGSGSGSGSSSTSKQPWNPNNCNAPWRPQQDPHYGHCHPVVEEESKYGLVPGTLGATNASNTATRSGGNASWSTQGSGPGGRQEDPQARLRARNRDRIRDGEGR